MVLYCVPYHKEVQIPHKTFQEVPQQHLDLQGKCLHQGVCGSPPREGQNVQHTSLEELSPEWANRSTVTKPSVLML